MMYGRIKTLDRVKKRRRRDTKTCISVITGPGDPGTYCSFLKEVLYYTNMKIVLFIRSVTQKKGTAKRVLIGTRQEMKDSLIN